jgi:hypothetical protein
MLMIGPSLPANQMPAAASCEYHQVRYPEGRLPSGDTQTGGVELCRFGHGIEAAHFLSAPQRIGGVCVVHRVKLLPRSALGTVTSDPSLYWRWSKAVDRRYSPNIAMARGPDCQRPDSNAYVSTGHVTSGEFLSLTNFWAELRRGQVDLTSWWSRDARRPLFMNSRLRADIARALSPSAHLFAIVKGQGRTCPYELISTIAPAEFIHIEVKMSGSRMHICTASHAIA